jgi:hypothetical protein
MWERIWLLLNQGWSIRWFKTLMLLLLWLGFYIVKWLISRNGLFFGLSRIYASFFEYFLRILNFFAILRLFMFLGLCSMRRKLIQICLIIFDKIKVNFYWLFGLVWQEFWRLEFFDSVKMSSPKVKIRMYMMWFELGEGYFIWVLFLSYY